MKQILVVKKDDKLLNVLVTYKRNQRHTYFRSDQDKILVSTGYHIKLKEIEKYILNKFDDLYKLVYQSNNKKISFLGKEFNRVDIKSNKDYYEIFDDKIIIYYKDDIKKSIDKLYINKLNEIKDYWYKNMENKFNKLGLSSNGFKAGVYKTIWGRCNIKTKIITINAYLMRYDLVYLECILNHEYCHLKYANHQKEFHDFYDQVFNNNRYYENNLKKLPRY